MMIRIEGGRDRAPIPVDRLSLVTFPNVTNRLVTPSLLKREKRGLGWGGGVMEGWRGGVMEGWRGGGVRGEECGGWVEGGGV